MRDRSQVNLGFDFGPHAASRVRAIGLCDFEGNSRTLSHLAWMR